MMLVFTIPLSAATTPQDVIRRFCDRDEHGMRLSSAGWKEETTLATWGDAPGWDHVTVIDGFRIGPATVKRDKATVTVVYSVAGFSSDDSFEPARKNETAVYKLVRAGETWKIDEPQLEPHVGRATLIEHMRSLGQRSAARRARLEETIQQMSASGDLTCKFDKRFKEGGFEEHQLTLTVVGDRVTGLTYSNAMSNGQEGGTYTCDIDLTDGAPGSKWVRSGATTRIIDTQADESYAEVKRKAGGRYEVRLGHLSTSEHCGFGAEFPDRVVLTPSSPNCVVRH